MKKVAIASAMGLATAAAVGLSGALAEVSASASDFRKHQFVLPRLPVREDHRNKKLKQKLRKQKRRDRYNPSARAARKVRRFGPGYRPGKLFKGHRI